VLKNIILNIDSVQTTGPKQRGFVLPTDADIRKQFEALNRFEERNIKD